MLYGAPDFLTLDGPGPATRGLRFFACAPNNPLSSMSRKRSLKSLAADIDAPTVRGTLPGSYKDGYAHALSPVLAKP